MASLFKLKSFLLGAVFASVTWAVIIYFYVNILEASLKYENHNQGTTRGLATYHFPREKEEEEEHLKSNFYRGHPNAIAASREKSVYYKQTKKSGENAEFGDKKIFDEWKNSLIKNELPGEEPHSAGENKPEKHPSQSSDSIDYGELGLVKTIADQEVREEGYRMHAFNVLISSRLSLHRPVPDTRHEKCRSLKYPHNLPTASIIICFYREEMFTLLRTVHSILNRTPSHLLKEVILVDDTDDALYHEGVKGNVSGISDKVLLTRTPTREGLIRARLFGSRQATGQVLIFLDSHVEVNREWIEPLLHRIHQNRTHVVTPMIDLISCDTFEYTSSKMVRGGFNWGLHFRWDTIPIQYFSDKSNFIKPIQSPTMAGGLFAIDKSYFVELGEYDPGMEIWGGENLEISFRIWMCGGVLEIMPCSRVGHIFRRRRPYPDLEGTNCLLKNSVRLAHVWMDEYIEKFFQLRPDGKRIDYGDISDRVALRKSLKCKSFDWYLKNIYPSLMTNETLGVDYTMNKLKKKFERWDRRSRNYLDQWQIQLVNTSLCIESEEEPSRKGARLVMSPCAGIPRQIFYHTDNDELVLAKLLCLQASTKMPRIDKCHDMKANQEWRIMRKRNIALYNIATGLCLAASESRPGAYVDMAMCSSPTLATWNLQDVHSKL